MTKRNRYGVVLAAVVVLALVAAGVAVWRRGTEREAGLRLNQRADRPESPAVSARYAAWSDRSRGSDSVIFVYDSVTGISSAVTSAERPASQPALAGGTLVYVDHARDEGDLVARELPAGDARDLVRAPGRQSAPSADGEWVVWEDDRTSYGPRIRARRLAGGEEIAMPQAAPGAVQRRPEVAGGYVVWEEYGAETTSAGTPRIYGFDLATRRVDAIATSPTVQLLPATDGRYVAWAEQRGDQLGVSVWDRRTDRRYTAPRRTDENVGEQTAPAVTDGVVLWIDRCEEGHLEVSAWRPGREQREAPDGPGSVNQVEVRAAEGSRLWLEFRRDRWFVRADLSGRETTSAEKRGAGAVPSVMRGAAAARGARLLPVQDAVAPSPPANVRASVAGTGAVSVRWEAARDDVRVSAYDVLRSPAPITAANRAQAAVVASTASTSATVPSAPGEREGKFVLYYAVLARDAEGNATLSGNSVPDPHGTSAAGAPLDTCTRCHFSGEGGVSPASRRSCYTCHGDTGDTRLYGAGSTWDTESAFRDDEGASLPATGSRHRNPFMSNTLRECDGCHTPHRRPAATDPAARHTKLLRTQLATAPAGQSGYRYSTAASPVGNQFCFDCHGPSVTPISLVGGGTAYLNAGGDHQTGWGANAHSRVPAPDADPGIQCGVCHDQHGSSAGRLIGKWDAATGTNRIAGTAVTGNDNSVCSACHAGASAGFPVATRDAAGYPVAGTWPGGAVYSAPYAPASHTGGIHNGGEVVWPGTGYAGGDCKNCHRIHGPANAYDLLRDHDQSGQLGSHRYSTVDFRFCFICHDGGPGADVRRFYPDTVGGTNTGRSAGHATRTSGTLPAGSPLPCYDCHNPHGSGSAYGLLVVTQTSATTTLALGDGPGELAMGPGRTSADVRRFCFTCHTTSDTTAGWNGSAMATVGAGARVEGIDRVSAAARLRLPAVNGHRVADTGSCYDCHGNDYGSGGANVHNPGGGISTGGVACYGCHGEYQATMERDGAQRTSWYHHVLGAGSVRGDQAPGSGTYPSALNPADPEVYCVSCHSDHNHFNANPGANLRLGIGLPGSQTTNTDFVATGSGGICVSCHSVELARDNVNQKAGGGPRTMSVMASEYAGTPHDYAALSSFNGSAFRGNCSKCHSDGRPASFQATPTAFSLHFALDWRLNQAMRLSVPSTATNTGSSACYRCHSTNAAENPNTAAGKDWYGISVMSQSSRRVRESVQQTYRHPVDANANAHSSVEVTPGARWPWSDRHVSCEDCHNSHAARPGVHTNGTSVGGPALRGSVGVKPAYPAPNSNWATPAAFTPYTLRGGSADWEAYLCFKCHSSYGGTPTGTSPSGGPRTDVAKDFNPANFSYHRVLGTDMQGVRTSFVVGATTYRWDIPQTLFKTGWTQSSQLTCSDCHTGNMSYARGPHGSSVQFMIDPAYPVLWGTTNARLRSSSPGMNPQLICAKCHVLYNGSSWGNNVHQKGDHQGVPCTYCHVGVPHGWSRPRMLSYTTDPAPYGSPRGTTSVRLRNHLSSGGENADWSKSDCGANCGEHPTSVSPKWP